ncbi:hypothetical protein KCU61_g377, partial [Aureobasidium melanogenum]
MAVLPLRPVFSAEVAESLVTPSMAALPSVLDVPTEAAMFCSLTKTSSRTLMASRKISGGGRNEMNSDMVDFEFGDHSEEKVVSIVSSVSKGGMTNAEAKPCVLLQSTEALDFLSSSPQGYTYHSEFVTSDDHIEVHKTNLISVSGELPEPAGTVHTDVGTRGPLLQVGSPERQRDPTRPSLFTSARNELDTDVAASTACDTLPLAVEPSPYLIDQVFPTKSCEFELLLGSYTECPLCCELGCNVEYTQRSALPLSKFKFSVCPPTDTGHR